jgi:uncharacterized membrane protein
MRPLRSLCRRLAIDAEDDEGSVLLLTLGYAVLAMVAILICVDATSLYLAQKRLDSLADAAALAAADGFEFTVADGEPMATLSSEAVRDQAQALVDDLATAASLVSATTPDGASARVTVAGTWHPPVLTVFVPDGVPLEATAVSRTALR